MKRGVLLALCACNPVFGIEPVEHRDARPIDAPFSCPTSGAPVFGSTVHQLIQRNCEDFVSLSSGYTMATCFEGGAYSSPTIVDGTEPGSLVEVPMFAFTMTSYFEHPRPSPDGNFLWIFHEVDTGFLGGTWEQYHRSNGAWQFDAAMPLGNLNYLYGSVGLDGGVHHIVVPTGIGVEEWTDANGWALVHSYTATDLGLADLNYAGLTEDSRRLLLVGHRSGDGTPHVFYGVRASAGAVFGATTLLDNVPASLNPYLSTDCARIYVSGLAAVFYVQQQ